MVASHGSRTFASFFISFLLQIRQSLIYQRSDMMPRKETVTSRLGLIGR